MLMFTATCHCHILKKTMTDMPFSPSRTSLPSTGGLLPGSTFSVSVVCGARPPTPDIAPRQACVGGECAAGDAR